MAGFADVGLRPARGAVERADTKIRDSAELLNVLLLDCFEPMIEPLLGDDPAFTPVALLRCRHCDRRGAINGGTETILHEAWCVVG